MVSDPKSLGCQVNSKRGRTDLQGPGERVYCLRVGGSVTGLGNEEINLEWGRHGQYWGRSGCDSPGKPVIVE